jgi:hypothetical protein
MSTIAQLVADIVAAPAPVLFLDTCAILDVVRAPRDEKAVRSVAAAGALVDLAKCVPPAVHLVVSDIIPSEWNANLASARADAEAAVKAYGYIADVIAAVPGMVGDHPLPLPQLTHLPDVVEIASRTLLETCSVIDREPILLSPAMDRVLAKAPPAKKKNDVKDWYILEHYLAVSRELTARAFSHWLIFASSNTSDFAEAGTRKPHPDLVADFSATGLRYAVSLDSAISQLRGNRQIPDPS